MHRPQRSPGIFVIEVNRQLIFFSPISTPLNIMAFNPICTSKQQWVTRKNNLSGKVIRKRIPDPRLVNLLSLLLHPFFGIRCKTINAYHNHLFGVCIVRATVGPANKTSDAILPIWRIGSPFVVRVCASAQGKQKKKRTRNQNQPTEIEASQSVG